MGCSRRKKGKLTYCWYNSVGIERSKVSGPDTMSDEERVLKDGSALGDRGRGNLRRSGVSAGAAKKPKSHSGALVTSLNRSKMFHKRVKARRGRVAF